MRQLLESLLPIAALCPPFVAASFLVYTLFHRDRAACLGMAFLGAVLGCMIGVSAAGGLNQSSGWVFGNFAAILVGIWAACIGSVLGLAVAFLINGGRGSSFVASALAALPLLFIGLCALVVPRLEDAEYQVWEEMIVEGRQPVDISKARSRLTGGQRQRLKQFSTDYPLEALPPVSIQTLYNLRVIDGDLKPMPPAVAWAIFEVNDRDIDLAGNVSAPPELIRKMAEGLEFDGQHYLVVHLARNPLTPGSEVMRLTRSIEKALLTKTDYYARQGLIGIMQVRDVELLEETWRMLIDRNLLDKDFRDIRLPLWVVREIYRPEDRDLWLAVNASVPPDLLSASLQTVDFQDPGEYHFLGQLGRNPSLSDDHFLFLKELAIKNQESPDRQFAMEARRLLRTLEQSDRTSGKLEAIGDHPQ